MSKANEIVKVVTSDLGKHRSSVGCGGSNDWCSQYVSHVLTVVGIGDVASLWCTYLYNNMSASKNWSEPDDSPVAGDIILFDWDGKADPLYHTRPLDHVGVVVGYSNGIITYIDGNGGGSQYICKRTIGINSGYVAHWMRYVGDANTSAPVVTPTPVAKPEVKPTPVPAKKYCSVELEQLSEGCKSPSVETMQNLLKAVGYKITADGDFGKNTSEALAKFQKSAGLEADRVCGKLTWKALIEAE